MISKGMGERLSHHSAIREAYERAEQMKQTLGQDAVFDLSIGNPTAPCPEGVARALRESAVDDAALHGYMDSKGYESVRAAIADSLNRRFGMGYTSEDLLMCTGAASGLNVIMQSLLDPGDEVVVFLPGYGAYAAFALTWGAKLVRVPYDRETLLPDTGALPGLLSPRTKMVLVNTPNNPTGLVYPATTARAIAGALDAAQQRFGHSIYLVSDEPYRDLVFDGAENPWWPALYRNTLVVFSFSKSASVAGERVGYVAETPGMDDAELLMRAFCRSLGDLGFVNAPASAQRIAAACADESVDIGYYDANRCALYRGLVELGFHPVRPNGAFYMLLPAESGEDEEAFVERLAQAGIITVGASAFGCPGYVRLSFCVKPQVVEGALRAFETVAEGLGLARPSGE